MQKLVGLLLCALAACATDAGTPGSDPGLDGLAITSVNPGTLVPGSRLVVTGRSFVDAPWGTTRLRLRGQLDGQAVDVALPARFAGYAELHVAFAGGRAAGLPADEGAFRGEAVVEVDSAVDGETHVSAPRTVELELAAQLTPTLVEVATGVIFVNDRIAVDGSGFLLGGGEGETAARVTGCFTLEGAGACLPITPIEVPARPDTAFDRSRAGFAFAPEIAGIQPGHFAGLVQLVNRHAGGLVVESASAPLAFDVVPPRIFRMSPSAASLGQFVDVQGGGFVGLPVGAPDPGRLITTVELDGQFTATGGAAVAVKVTLVPEFAEGRRLRYVLSEDDDLGQRIDLRKESGAFAGTARPIVQQGGTTVRGDASAVSLALLPVRQVVWLNFQPSYVESLRHFGLRAADARLRERVLAVARRDYAGVNLDFRTSPPDDFAYYAQVDLSGPDPNGLGLFGYDNSPGKDMNNQRLYDRIGGVNAQTQQDGFPGYGGVFVESFFGFSAHPGGFAQPLDGADAELFDAVFEPFRPDRGGRPVSADDFANLPMLGDGAGCPAAKSDRPGQIACAVWVLGNMIGTTMTHEVGHSLGLANPSELMSFHNTGDQPNRLMDSGGARTFNERAELAGEGPARFCDGDFAYLRAILPATDSAPAVSRPSCF